MESEGFIMDDLLSKSTIKKLFSLSNVVGIGRGLKETAGQLTDQEAVVVMVSTKVAEDQLARDQVVPKSIEGNFSDVIEVGKISARKSQPDYNPDLISDTRPIDKSRKSKWRPAPGGVSIGHYQITAGTLGAVVYDNCSGRPLILSNNHVLANSTDGKDHLAEIGDPILQPGPLDGGTIAHDTIGTLYKFVPLKDKGFNVVDAAVAKPFRPSLVVPYILGVGIVKGTTHPKLGMKIKKSGRTTGLTHSRIRAVNAMILVDYDGRILKFKHQIVADVFDEPGDSGSLVLNKRNRAVGLLFAGSDEFTFMNPIDPVLDLLCISFKKPITRE
ncbi:MAG TPA: hypothetical protein VN426_02180 [Syntrophomonadaceae bacterium]|nr:hypothetical protein [Syntrophomonadaceae bacterium]